MELLNMSFYYEPIDCEWLRKVHLGERIDYKFSSFVLYGNEDDPAKVDLYASDNPSLMDKPYTVVFI